MRSNARRLGTHTSEGASVRDRGQIRWEMGDLRGPEALPRPPEQRPWPGGRQRTALTGEAAPRRPPAGRYRSAARDALARCLPAGAPKPSAPNPPRASFGRRCRDSQAKLCLLPREAAGREAGLSPFCPCQQMIYLPSPTP